MANGDGGNVIVVKNWHVVLTLVGWLVIASASYASMNAAIAENTRRIQKLEEQPSVTFKQYDAGVTDLKQRLERIERHLDAQDSQHKR